MTKIIVFDFDKTLTYNDSLLEYFVFCGKGKRYYLLRGYIFLFLVLLKRIHVLNLKQLKNFGIRLFLHKINKELLEKKSREFVKTIRLNSIYYHDFLNLKSKSKVIVISAALDTYLSHLFPDVKLIASNLYYEKGFPIRLSYHCSYSNKVKSLNDSGITHIDILYTDSILDLPLARIASHIYLVKNDKKIKCESVQDFIEATRLNGQSKLIKIKNIIKIIFSPYQ